MVFDAPADVRADRSLNDCFEKRDNLYRHILKISLHFRTHSIALNGDIQEEFLQISITEAELDVFRFLWFSKTPQNGFGDAQEAGEWAAWFPVRILLGRVPSVQGRSRNGNDDLFIKKYVAAPSLGTAAG